MTYLEEWKKANPDKVREHRNRSNRKLRTQVLAIYGGVCVCCGEKEEAFLTLDHINGGGTAERKIVWGMRWLRQLRDSPRRKDLRILCANCHQAIHRDGKCPHGNDLEN